MLFLRTAAALHDRGGIDVALPSTSHAAVAQRFSFRAVVGVLVEAHGHRIRLTHLNTGATRPFAFP